jgi:hypothetical protein
VRSGFETDDQDELLPKQSEADADAAKDDYAKTASVFERSPRRRNWHRVSKIGPELVQQGPTVLFKAILERYGDLHQLTPLQARHAVRSWLRVMLKCTDPTVEWRSDKVNTSPAIRQDVNRVLKAAKVVMQKRLDENAGFLDDEVDKALAEMAMGLPWISDPAFPTDKDVEELGLDLVQQILNGPITTKADEFKRYKNLLLNHSITWKASKKNPRKK